MMLDICHKLTINGVASEVWDALATKEGVCSWLTNDLDFSSRSGSEVRFGFPGGWVKGKIVGFEPEVKLHIIFKQNSGMKEWLNTELIITLEESDGEHTVVRFYHKNWLAPSDHYMQWNYTWALLLRNLELYVEEATARTIQDLS